MNRGRERLIGVVVSVGCAVAFAAASQEWLSVVPAGQRDALVRRLDIYMKTNRGRNWGKAYDFISDAGRGGINRTTFVAIMRTAHRREFANSPDLLEFSPVRAVKADKEYDLYGCGQARRERRDFKGVVLIHAVFEHNDWFFSGWAFTRFPNEPCTALSDPSWEAPSPMEWNQPLEELRSSGAVPFHVDK
jgi:hypothetical protein